METPTVASAGPQARHSAAQDQSRPGPPPVGAGRFTLALTGTGVAEYPPAGANTPTADVSGGGGASGAVFLSPELV